MTEDFSVPSDFKARSQALYGQETVTNREFVDFCLLAMKLLDKHWDNRQGIAYHIAGLWLNHKNIADDPLLDEIGAEFGTLELPDNFVGKDEAAVRAAWHKVEQLVTEAANTV